MNKRLKLVIVLVCSLVAGGAWHYVHKKDISVEHVQSYVQLRDFEYDRDQAFIKKLFNQNWYWLVASDQYDVDYMLYNRASSKNPPRIGDLILKTLYTIDNKQVGFLAYYKESFCLGRILFVSVDKEFRSRGYAKYMVQSALDGLRSEGIGRVRLVTRTENYAAQKVYTSLGFTEERRNSVFVHYQINF